ncbi:hypothetical protein ACLI1A_05270 [Flavobacterium sp. RHBU_3]|uniref:hypothetical protein n=1 Tax=Flavobacterium sp. RHBU_3 TaxID=3391184 RepID=UPI00398524F5
MKKPLLLFAACFSLVSCDYILKKQDDTAKTVQTDTTKVMGTETETDKNGCVISAGYRWSVLKNDCIRPVEDAYRLNSVEKVEDESAVKSAFVVFDEEKENAELYLPDTQTSVILKKKTDNVYIYGAWSLHSDKGYSLKHNGVLLYVGAEPVQEGQVTGDENPES